MAAITPAQLTGGRYHRRTGSAQANTGQVDWIVVPQWATYAEIFLDVTATAGTTPIATPSIDVVDPIALNDSNVATIATFTTPPTGAGTHRISIGPGVTGIADDVVLAATGDSVGAVNIVLPPILGVRLTLDRTTGNETYTYTLTTIFRP